MGFTKCQKPLKSGTEPILAVFSLFKKEAAPGFEPGVKILQTPA